LKIAKYIKNLKNLKKASTTICNGGWVQPPLATAVGIGCRFKRRLELPQSPLATAVGACGPTTDLGLQLLF
jgi:hypothetical protein